jgi:hypothetical protein
VELQQESENNRLKRKSFLASGPERVLRAIFKMYIFFKMQFDALLLRLYIHMRQSD